MGQTIRDSGSICDDTGGPGPRHRQPQGTCPFPPNVSPLHPPFQANTAAVTHDREQIQTPCVGGRGDTWATLQQHELKSQEWLAISSGMSS